MQQERLVLDGSAQAHINAYLEYRNIVGDDDNGRLFTEEEYEEYKRNVAEARRNRLYVSWRNSQGLDCRNVGPSTKCFCEHTYRQHAFDNYQDKNVHCKRCRCRLFEYVPVRGTQDVKCHCKHSYTEHNANSSSRLCQRAGCGCTGFNSSLSCSCGESYKTHRTVIESQQERKAGGRRITNLAGAGGMYAALGGITDFSSLLDGVERMQIRDDGSAVPTGIPGRQRVGGPAGSTRRAAAVPFDDDDANFVFPPSHGGKMSEHEEMDAYAKRFDKRYGVRSKPRPKAASGSSRSTRPAAARRAQAIGDSSNPASGRGRGRGPGRGPGREITSAIPPRSLSLLKRKHGLGAKSKGHGDTSGETANSAAAPAKLGSSWAVNDIVLRMGEVEKQLQDPSLGGPQRYALKKKFAQLRAQKIREERKAKQQQQQQF